MRTRSLFAVLCFLLPVAASAVPIEIQLVGDSGSSTSSVDCLRGSCGTQLIGTLNADMDGDLVTGVSGNVLIDGLGSVDVTDGLFDFSGRTSSYLTTSHFGSFNFSSVSWNSGYFSFWGGNWGNSCYSYTSCKLLWLRVRGTITPNPASDIPEPSAALLFGAGAFVVSRRVSRRR